MHLYSSKEKDLISSRAAWSEAQKHSLYIKKHQNNICFYLVMNLAEFLSWYFVY